MSESYQILTKIVWIMSLECQVMNQREEEMEIEGERERERWRGCSESVYLSSIYESPLMSRAASFLNITLSDRRDLQLSGKFSSP